MTLREWFQKNGGNYGSLGRNVSRKKGKLWDIYVSTEGRGASCKKEVRLNIVILYGREGKTKWCTDNELLITT